MPEAPAVTTPQSTTAGTPPQVTPPTEGKTSATTPPPVAGKEAKPNPNVFKVKVNGVESEVSVTEAMPELAEVWPTLSDAAKLRVIAMHQKDLGASKRLEEAHRLRAETKAQREEVEGIISLLKNGSEDEVEAVLSRMGRNTRQWAENLLARELRKEMMDPKERELLDAKAERDALLAEKKAKAEEAEKAEIERKTKERAAKIKDALARNINAVLKDSDLPANERTVGKIAYYMQQAVRRGDPIDVEEIRDQVIQDYKADYGAVFKAATPQQIVSIIGEEKLKEIRKWDNDRIVGKKKKPEEEKTGPSGARQHMKKKFKTPEEDNLERFGTLYPNIVD